MRYGQCLLDEIRYSSSNMSAILFCLGLLITLLVKKCGPGFIKILGYTNHRVLRVWNIRVKHFCIGPQIFVLWGPLLFVLVKVSISIKPRRKRWTFKEIYFNFVTTWYLIFTKRVSCLCWNFLWNICNEDSYFLKKLYSFFPGPFQYFHPRRLLKCLAFSCLHLIPQVSHFLSSFPHLHLIL